MNKSQDDKVMIIERGSVLLFCGDERTSDEVLDLVHEVTGCDIVAVTGVNLVGVIPPQETK
ncbi:MAG: hypothetical protein ACRC3H_02640 [Lachnospiraceae bacterium]